MDGIEFEDETLIVDRPPNLIDEFGIDHAYVAE